MLNCSVCRQIPLDAASVWLHHLKKKKPAYCANKNESKNLKNIENFHVFFFFQVKGLNYTQFSRYAAFLFFLEVNIFLFWTVGLYKQAMSKELIYGFKK